MTLPILFRRQPSPRPRRCIVDVTNHWRITPEGYRREVLVREPDGELATRYLADDHPALVRFLDRAAAAAVAA
jgi:hypothetical protein